MCCREKRKCTHWQLLFFEHLRRARPCARCFHVWEERGLLIYVLGISTPDTCEVEGRTSVGAQESASVGKPSLSPVHRVAPWGRPCWGKSQGTHFAQLGRFEQIQGHRGPVSQNGKEETPSWGGGVWKLPQVGREVLHFWACRGGRGEGKRRRVNPP